MTPAWLYRGRDYMPVVMRADHVVVWCGTTRCASPAHAVAVAEAEIICWAPNSDASREARARAADSVRFNLTYGGFGGGR